MNIDKFDFGRAKEVARALTNRRSGWNALVAGLTGPIPGTSVVLTGMEAQLTYKIAKIYGYNITLQEAGVTITGLIAASGGLKVVATEASTFIPVVGWWVIKPSIAAAAAKAVGELAIGHFEQKRKKGE